MLFKPRKRFFTGCLAGFLLVIGISGCGFKLAGTSQLPESLDSLHLVTKGFNDQQREALVSVLKQAGVSMAAAGEGKGNLSVELKSLPERNVISSASTGKTIVGLARQLDFTLKPNDDSQATRSKSLTQQRNFELDEDNLLSSGQQKTDAFRDLELSLYNQLVFQMQRF